MAYWEQNRATIHVNSNTCAFAAMTSQNVLCKKGLYAHGIINQFKKTPDVCVFGL